MLKLALVIVLSCLSAVGYSQTVASHNVAVELMEMMGISIIADYVDESNAINPFVFDDPNEFAGGITRIGGAVFSVNSTVDWLVSFKSTDVQFENAAATASMPLSIVEVKESLAGAYAQLSSSEQPLANGQAVLDLVSMTSSFTADYKVNPSIGQMPGEYTANITYSISAQ